MEAKRSDRPNAALLVVLVACALAACTPREAVLSPPPQATEQQVAREVLFIQQNFHTRSCFAPLKESQTSVEFPAEAQGTYSVELPAPELVHDAFHYVVVVRKADRMGYLIRSGGIAGTQEHIGPLSLVPCLQEVFKPVSDGKRPRPGSSFNTTAFGGA